MSELLALVVVFALIVIWAYFKWLRLKWLERRQK